MRVLSVASSYGNIYRRCPGIAVAQSSVWLAAALTLAVYDVTAVIDNDGNPILPSLEYTNGTIRYALIVLRTRRD
jgi:hypothetical protein